MPFRNLKKHVPVIEKSPKMPYYPVSLQQEGVYLQTLLDPDNTVWNTSHSWRYQGKLDLQAFKKAVQTLIERHAGLRTNFELKGEEIFQFIHEEVSIDSFFTFVDLSEKKERETTARSIEEEAAAQPYDLFSDPLIRFRLIRMSECDHVIVISKHHIISDVTTRQLIWKELVTLYNAYASGRSYDLEPVEIQYADYAVWQQGFLKSPYYKKQEDYWLNRLCDDGKGKSTVPVLNFPTDFPRGEKSRSKTAIYQVFLDRELVSGLRTFVLRKRVSFSAPFWLAFYILLNRYCGQEDMIIGTLYRGRNIDKKVLNKIIGLFANRIALRLDMKESGDTVLGELLKRVDARIIEAYRNQDYLFEDLIRTLHPARPAEHAPVFQVVFNMLRMSAGNIEFDGLTRKEWQGLELDTNISSQYDLSIYVTDNFTDISIRLLYPTELFEVQTIKRISAQYHRILRQVVEDPGKKLSEIDMITEEERHRILYEFNDTAADYPGHKTIHGLFAEQAARTPDRAAVVGFFPDRTYRTYWTYKQLDEASNHLAYLLREKGVKTGDIVGIMMERSLERMAGIFAILKTGGAYLPIDPGYPEQRIEYILKDSGVKVLLSNLPEGHHLFNCQLSIVNCQLLMSGFKAPVHHSGHLVYVIYTSGSTGKPKGVMVEHRALVNRLFWMQKQYPIGGGDIILHKTPYTFDVSVWEIFWWSLVGAGVCLLPPGGEKDPRQMAEAIERHGVTIMHFVPSMLSAFLEYIDGSGDAGRLGSLKQVIASGEALNVSLVRKFNRLLNSENGTALANLYGPTEAAIDVSFYDCPVVEPIYRIPIGRPIDNIKLFVVDKQNRLQPVGVAGELFITGDGLARGYLNKPELTAEKFINKSFVGVQGAVFQKSPLAAGGFFYKTGDLARWLLDGNIEFLGRIDYQVKIRGNRIELGEIETVLNDFSLIKEAVVTAVDDPSGGKSLCAYVAAAKTMNPSELREYLAKKLPDYMMPSYFVQLEEFPLTRSGKVDRKVLPAPDINEATGTAGGRATYEAPQNPVQQALVSVWQEVLGLETIGINDHFIALGGDSIKAIQVASRLSKYGYKLEIALLFRHPVIKKLSPHVTKVSGTIDQRPVIGHIKPIPIQQWFLQRVFTARHHWNLAVMLYREEGFDPGILRKVLANILVHHDLLRAVLSPDAQVLINKGIGEMDVPLEIFDLAGEENIEKEAERLQASIDLFNGPLMRTGLFRIAESDHLLITVHHLAIDGISWRILFEDISLGYRQAVEGKEIAFPAKTHSYKQWAEALEEHSRSGPLLREYDYWKDICSKGKNGLSTGAKKGKLKDYYRYSIYLDEEESRLLWKEVHHAYNTEINDLLLSGLSLALRECFGWTDVVINLEGHGREPITQGVDITRTVGWFTTQYPVLLEACEKDDLSMHIRRTKETLRKIPHRGIGYGVLRYMSELPEPDRKVLEIEPEIGFNYMGAFDEDLGRSGFKRSRFSTGSAKSPESEQIFKININGMKIDSKLTFTIAGDTQTYDKETIKPFAESFKTALKKVIRHCKGIEETVYTPGDYDAKELDFDQLEKVYQYQNSQNISRIFHLSPMQEGMLFHHLYDPNDAAYIVQLHYLLEGNVDTGVFQKSCEQLVRQQEVFRTAFIYKDIKRPVQVVLKERETVFTYHDQTDIQRISTEERNKGFDLQKDPLIRFVLIKKGSRAYWLLVTYHHIIMDGWSTNLWLKDFLAIYHHEYKSINKDVVSNTVYPYGTYLKWLEAQDFGMAHDYWRRYLEGFDQVTRIQLARPSAGDYLKQEYTIQVHRETNAQLSALAREAGVTLNNVLQGVWSVVLHRYAGSHDVVFGHVISGRNISLEGVEQVVGLFINTIPMRVKIDGAQSFTGMLKDIQDALLESQQYGYLSLAEVQGYAALEGQVFDHIYVYENYPVNREIPSQKQMDKVGFQLTRKYSIERTNYDLNIIIIPRENLRIRLLYNGNIYDHSFISKLAGHIERVMEQVVRQPDRLVSDFELVTHEEKRQLLYEFNDTAADYPKNKTIHALYEEQTARTPDRMAVVGFFSNRTYRTYWTYKKLNEASNHLAYLLLEKGVKPGHIVGIMMGRCVERMMGIFAILKAGGAYLPIDPTYPGKRIEYILKDSGIGVLLTNLPEGHRFNCQLSIVNCQLLMSLPQATLHHSSFITYHSDLAYVIYTSGSTGKPKGVMVEHRPLVNRLNWMQKKYPIGVGDTILHKTPFTFDVSVWEIFWWSIVGARVCLLPPGGERDPKQMKEAIERYRVTVMHFVPSMLSIFLEYIEEAGVKNIKHLSSLRQVIASGEALTPSMVRTFNRLLHKENGTLLANLYGPTEATIDVSFFDCPPVEEVEQVPIGKPIDNIQLLVFSKDNQLQPVGVAGELCIAGDGLARGYLNKPELTADKFINKSFCGVQGRFFQKEPLAAGGIFYKTGDLARWLSNANIEFLGRIDYQVKIRGNRIELGEIEAVLDKHPAIKESVVTAAADSSGDTHLCAYIVSKESLTIEQLREHLEKALPDYMIPSYFVPIEKIPLTANGKVDRKSLPLPEPNKTMRIGAKFEPPTNETEETLVALWQELLKKEKIGIHDNFFHLGGHSLKVMNLVAQIHKTFAVEIPMREIFDKPFVADIAKLIRDKEEKRKKVEQILQEIEGLSDEQVLELLG